MPFVADDLVDVTLHPGTPEQRDITLALGDPVEPLGLTPDGKKMRVRLSGGDEGLASNKLQTRSTGVFRFSLVDVQQGDGMVMESPSGKLVFVDGGDNELFASYVAARFPGSTKEQPKRVDAVVITHGDADHFAGLNEIVARETHRNPRRRLFLSPARLFHNGIIKGPSPKRGEDPLQIFGAHVEAEGKTWITELADDFLSVPKERMNRPFQAWKKTLEHWERGKPAAEPRLTSHRLEKGMDHLFDFLAEDGVKVEILGPVTTTIDTPAGKRPALPWLHEPSRSFEEKLTDKLSASHTINGHSITLRVTVGNVRFLLGGDLNAESMASLLEGTELSQLEAEVVKVPHHGSADFDFKALKAMNPFIWLISSGDESARKEFIHPRANLMGALGAASRTGLRPLIFCTELAAFFEMRGPATTRAIDQETGQPRSFFGFERTNFGIVHIRTDGERLLVFTHSGKEGTKEAYAYTVDGNHKVKAQTVRKK